MTEAVIAFNVGTFQLGASACDAHSGVPLFELRIDTATGTVAASPGTPEALCHFLPGQPPQNTAALIVRALEAAGTRLTACVHRVAHGGMRYRGMQAVDDAVLAFLEALEPLCPLHQPPALELIHHLRRIWPGLPQYAMFDTAFHLGQPAIAHEYALPAPVREAGIHAYGFHGISCQSILRQLGEQDPALAGARLVIAHLGSTASMTAVAGGRSMACTMGFSTLDGLPMGTHPGRLDPAVLVYLLERGWNKSRLVDLLYHQSGLLGLSGISADMRTLLGSQDEKAHFAVDYFCHHASRAVGALATDLGGLDAIVFTAGIGETQPAVRARMAQRLAWMGVQLDELANQANRQEISAPASRVRVLVLRTREEAEMLRQWQEVAGEAARRGAPEEPA